MSPRWPCEETTLDLKSHDYEVRLWITYHPGSQVPNIDDWQQAIDDIIQYTDDVAEPYIVEKLAHEIALYGKLLWLAAVQVRYRGVGHMIYTIPFDA